MAAGKRLRHLDAHINPIHLFRHHRKDHSLQSQLFLYVFISLIIIVISMSYILYASMQLQRIVDEQFRTEQFFQELQQEAGALETPVRTYLSTRSSTALAELLSQVQNLKSMIPDDYPFYQDPVELQKHEIYALLHSYLGLIDEAIEQKRGRAISEYTRLYEEMGILSDYIEEQIDNLSLYGFREQLSSYERVITISRQLQFWNLLVIIFAFIWAITWMMSSLNRVTGPMHRLSEMAGELAGGDFSIDDIDTAEVSIVELKKVFEAFNQMKHDIRQNIDDLQDQKRIEQDYLNEKLRNLKMEQLLKRMELYTMQAQMNPHFLFNTLNTGVQLAIREDADDTAEYMENLALFFRHNMRERKLFVPLSHEIEGLKSYFYILGIRFPKSLEIKLEIAPSVSEEIRLGTGSSCLIPAMILQPIVENSVVHAFKGIDRKGEILVHVWEEAERICFSVKDNGIGIEKETMDNLLKTVGRTTEFGAKIMGLENVIQRLHFFYPEKPDIITIISEPGNGTEVRITIDREVEPCITF